MSCLYHAIMKVEGHVFTEDTEYTPCPTPGYQAPSSQGRVVNDLITKACNHNHAPPPFPPPGDQVFSQQNAITRWWNAITALWIIVFIPSYRLHDDSVADTGPAARAQGDVILGRMGKEMKFQIGGFLLMSPNFFFCMATLKVLTFGHIGSFHVSAESFQISIFWS